MRILLLTLTLAILSASCSAAEPHLKALIVDGQNNHGDWPKTTFMMKHYLEQTELFSVDVERTRYTWKGEKHLKKYSLPYVNTRSLPDSRTDPQFSPRFDQYDLVVNNFGWKCAPWPEATRQAFVEYMRKGGGLVVVHAADNCWPEWVEYNEMIALGGWGGRNHKSGPYVYFDKKDELITDSSRGPGGGHGPQSAFEVVTRDASHPIMKGLPTSWMHAKDELYNKLRGPAENLTVLATAFSPLEQRGTGRHEPMLMAINYGQGRVFHSTLGHADYSMECVGFRTTFQRGAEWAATGKVTQPVPNNFPDAESTSTQQFTK